MILPDFPPFYRDVANFRQLQAIKTIFQFFSSFFTLMVMESNTFMYFKKYFPLNACDPECHAFFRMALTSFYPK